MPIIGEAVGVLQQILGARLQAGEVGTDGPYGEADVLARAKNTSVERLADAGVHACLLRHAPPFGEAVEHAISRAQVLAVLAPPGTGKTTLAGAIVAALLRAGRTASAPRRRATR